MLRARFEPLYRYGSPRGSGLCRQLGPQRADVTLVVEELRGQRAALREEYPERDRG
jgi:hypothetical protein